MRWADFGPTPGRRPSSSIRLWTGGAYTRGSAEQAAAQTTEVEAAHGLLGDLAGLGDRIPDGGEHQVLQHGDVVGVDGRGVNGDSLELHAAGDPHLHHAAPGLA